MGHYGHWEVSVAQAGAHPGPGPGGALSCTWERSIHFLGFQPSLDPLQGSQGTEKRANIYWPTILSRSLQTLS